MSTANFEKLIELIINEDEQGARNLFHKIVVATSKKIYESFDDEMEEDLGGDKVDGFVKEIEVDEHSGQMYEDDMEPEMGSEDGDEFGSEGEFDGDEFSDEEGLEGGNEFGDETGLEAGAEEGELEDRVVDLEDALDELKAEFAKLMDEEPGEEDSSEDESGEEESGEEEEEMDESLREYVEKAPAAVRSEEGSVNKKSTVITGKNDMGGTVKNIARGGSNPDPKGPKGPSNEYSKGEGRLIGDVQNTAGGKKKLSPAPAAKKTGEEPGVNKRSTID